MLLDRNSNDTSLCDPKHVRNKWVIGERAKIDASEKV